MRFETSGLELVFLQHRPRSLRRGTIPGQMINCCQGFGMHQVFVQSRWRLEVLDLSCTMWLN